jgi:phosphohistidine swiveling domain-containing protein
MGFFADLHHVDVDESRGERPSFARPGPSREGMGTLPGFPSQCFGGKARSLLRLSAAGLSTPPAFVVTDELFRALCPLSSLPEQIDEAALVELDRTKAELMAAPWPGDFQSELRQRLSSAPDALWSVRSSFAGEDMVGGLGAGVYESVVAVPSHKVEAALRQVLASALSAGAVAYALAHGMRPAAPPVSVLIHPYISGEAEGGAACEPARLDQPLIQVRTGRLTAETTNQLREALQNLARTHGAIEIEWVVSGEKLFFLQMRPYQPPAEPAPWQGWADLEAGETPSQWRWDQAHNPLPLSPVHAGLVDLVDECCRTGIRQCVLGQYLFYAPDSRSGLPPISAEAAPARFAALLAEVESRLDGFGETPPLESALDLLLAIEEPIFGVIQPALRAARTHLTEFLQQEAPAALSGLARLLVGVASKASERRQRAAALRAAPDSEARARALVEYLELFGDETPVWDVAIPTGRESPEFLGSSEGFSRDQPEGTGLNPAAAQVEAQIAPQKREEWRRRLHLARQAAGLGEDDDWLYARVQAAVRRALVQLGIRLQAQGALAEASEVFFLPLKLVRSLADGTPPPADLKERAAAGRAAWEAACQDPPPVKASPDAVSVKGVGIGGRAVGRVVLHNPAHPRPSAGQILVAPTFLPSELPLLVAAALVTETGGPLDHVANQARERHLPAVVGAAGACRIFHDGDLVLVDADRGMVVRIGKAS